MRVGPGQRSCVQPDAERGADEQRPQPPHDVTQIAADEGLPDVGDHGRHDDDGERVARRHRGGEQAHRYRGQAEPDHALDEARQQEHGGDEQQEGVQFRHIPRLTHAGRSHNVEVTEVAFAIGEG
jgi:hypothetical protein